MSKVGITLSIDVTKIDKSKLFSGKKGTYLDAQVFVDISGADEYGNSGMITQAVSKEEREQGVKGAILGNVKVFWREPNGQAPQYQQPQQQAPVAQQAPVEFDDTIPF